MPVCKFDKCCADRNKACSLSYCQTHCRGDPSHCTVAAHREGKPQKMNEAFALNQMRVAAERVAAEYEQKQSAQLAAIEREKMRLVVEREKLRLHGLAVEQEKERVAAERVAAEYEQKQSAQLAAIEREKMRLVVEQEKKPLSVEREKLRLDGLAVGQEKERFAVEQEKKRLAVEQVKKLLVVEQEKLRLHGLAAGQEKKRLVAERVAAEQEKERLAAEQEKLRLDGLAAEQEKKLLVVEQEKLRLDGLAVGQEKERLVAEREKLRLDGLAAEQENERLAAEQEKEQSAQLAAIQRENERLVVEREKLQSVAELEKLQLAVEREKLRRVTEQEKEQLVELVAEREKLQSAAAQLAKLQLKETQIGVLSPLNSSLPPPYLSSALSSAVMPSATAISPFLPKDDTFWVGANKLQYGSLIGSGAFGKVFCGQFRGKPVAIKKLLSGEKHVKEAFQKEVNVLRHLQHPNVVALEAATLDEDHLAMVMELGGSSLFRPEEKFSDEQCLSYSLDIARGVAYLHEQNILHRDLKSLNVILSLDGKRAKICDFGLAKSRQMNSLSTKVVGTCAWMAPELIEGESATQASDVYACGVIFWELISQEIPYAFAQSPALVPVLIGKGKKPGPIPESCPDFLKIIIEQAWGPIGERPTAAKLVDLLEQGIAARR